jgi:hypothetical protein
MEDAEERDAECGINVLSLNKTGLIIVDDWHL